MLETATLPGGRIVRGLVHIQGGAETCFGVIFPAFDAPPDTVFALEELEQRIEEQIAGEAALAVSNGWRFGEWALWGEMVFLALRHENAGMHWTCRAPAGDPGVTGNREMEQVAAARRRIRPQNWNGSENGMRPGQTH
jgi:hypothetical protein